MEAIRKDRIWIVKFRDFTIRDIRLGVRSRGAAQSALRYFEEHGYITELPLKWERPFLGQLVNAHGENERDFEHFLLKTWPGIRPTDILPLLHERSPEYIPTLAAVHLYRPAGPNPSDWMALQIHKLVETDDLIKLLKDIRDPE